MKKYFKITSMDISPDMLKLARKLNPEVTYAQGDMRFARLKKQFDAVTIFDAINYMVTKDDLRAVFETAFEHLKPGGVMTTIVEETPDSFKQNLTRSTCHKQGETDVVFIENLFDPDPKDTSYELTLLYLIRSKGKLRVETDHHLCGIFSLQTWIGLLEDTGFKVNKMEFNVSDPEARAYPVLVCVKPQ
jgi:SAM-dependent methyltransferase